MSRELNTHPWSVGASSSDQSKIFENLCTKNELCEKLHLSISYISELMAKDGLPYFKIGRAVRFRISEIVAFLERKRRP